ncbi:hypothetical protein GGR56DRAFT_674539 [Xylariaceae sp. FL0804]|nr:hypothetical protein GGR56DRAFT_674539 [Xylariaceae sp. FL0804]
MKPPTRIALRSVASRPKPPSPAALLRQIHSTSSAPATVSPIHSAGPPPAPPQPSADSPDARLERRKKQAAMLEKAREIRAAQKNPNKASGSGTGRNATSTAGGGSSSSSSSSSPLARKRFWKHVHVREADDGSGALEVHLDQRPLRRPNTKEVVRVPRSKPLLAAALALEWDQLVSAQQATRQHLIPLTSLVCRALDIADDDANDNAAKGSSSSSNSSIRAGVAAMLMRYLDTDSLLCWAPPPSDLDAHAGDGGGLRGRQERAAAKVTGFLSARVWPGVEIAPALDGASILPRAQPAGTRAVIAGWVAGLDAWELAGLERAALAGKSLLGAARLLAEWSEGGAGVGVFRDGDGDGDGVIGAGAGAGAGEKRFGAEEAARLVSIEVDWQTGRWGEVEDTHDVEKEDLRRQLGSVVLLVGGNGGPRL